MVDFEKNNGLVPVIVQDVDTNEVLMLAYMNEEALKLTQETGYAHYFSRSRNKIWKKGEKNSARSAQKPSEDYRTIYSDFQGFLADFSKKSKTFLSTVGGG